MTEAVAKGPPTRNPSCASLANVQPHGCHLFAADRSHFRGPCRRPTPMVVIAGGMRDIPPKWWSRTRPRMTSHTWRFAKGAKRASCGDRHENTIFSQDIAREDTIALCRNWSAEPGVDGFRVGRRVSKSIATADDAPEWLLPRLACGAKMRLPAPRGKWECPWRKKRDVA